jgi:Lon protease-like protein
MSEEERTLNDELDEGQESDDDVAEVGTDDNGPETVSEGANDDPEAVDRPLSERTRLPVLPLRGTVTFPAVAAPIAAGREMTIKAIDAAIAGDKRIFAVAQKEAEVEEPDADALFRVGTVARIAQMQRVPGGVQMVIQGEERGAALEYSIKDGYMEVVSRRMEDMPPLDPEESAFAALYKEVRERAAELSRLRGVPKEIVDHLLGGISAPGELADLVAFYTELDTDEKQELLETLSVEDRLRKLLIHLQRQIGVLEAQEQIRSKVQEELGERQREIFLREQLKAIHKELGEDVDSQEAEELRERLEALEIPEEARKEVDRELRRRAPRSPGDPGRGAQGGRPRAAQAGAYPPGDRRGTGHSHLPGDRRGPALVEEDGEPAGPEGGGSHPRAGPLRTSGRQGPCAGLPRGTKAPRGEERQGRSRVADRWPRCERREGRERPRRRAGSGGGR